MGSFRDPKLTIASTSAHSIQPTDSQSRIQIPRSPSRSSGLPRQASVASRAQLGYIFGAPIAYVLGRRMCLARRPGKLPRETLVDAYEMSYAPTKALAIQGEAIRQGDRVVIVDDIIASGGSALAAINLIEKAGGHCAGIVCLAAFPN